MFGESLGIRLGKSLRFKLSKSFVAEGPSASGIIKPTGLGTSLGFMLGKSLLSVLRTLIDFVRGTIFGCVLDISLGFVLGASLGFVLRTSLGFVLGAPLGSVLGTSLDCALDKTFGFVLGKSLGITRGKLVCSNFSKWPNRSASTKWTLRGVLLGAAVVDSKPRMPLVSVKEIMLGKSFGVKLGESLDVRPGEPPGVRLGKSLGVRLGKSLSDVMGVRLLAATRAVGGTLNGARLGRSLDTTTAFVVLGIFSLSPEVTRMGTLVWRMLG